jgi:hypothetical protein
MVLLVATTITSKSCTTILNPVRSFFVIHSYIPIYFVHTCGGGCHNKGEPVDVELLAAKSKTVALRKLSRDKLASWNTCRGWMNASSCTTLFLWNQIFQATTTMSSRSITSHCSIQNSNKLMKVSVPFWNFLGPLPHTYWAEWQIQKLCFKVSSSLVQSGQMSTKTTPRLSRFDLVGRRSLHSLHINILLA